MNGSVLLDTNVFTARLRDKSPLASAYARHLFGQRLLVTPQTLAEARYGALKASWGRVRLERLAQLTARTRLLPGADLCADGQRADGERGSGVRDRGP